MTWEKFREATPDARIRLLCPVLVKRANRCLEQYKRAFPDHKRNEALLQSLLVFTLSFHLAHKKHNVIAWTRHKLPENAKNKEHPQTKGEFYLGLIGHYGPLCFGWRLDRSNSSNMPGLLQIVTEHFNRMGDDMAFLCYANLSGKTIEDTVERMMAEGVIHNGSGVFIKDAKLSERAALRAQEAEHETVKLSAVERIKKRVHRLK